LWSRIKFFTPEVAQNRTVGLFGRLEELDISLIPINGRNSFQGCIATIAWLTGGRLTKINMHGISTVTVFDTNVLLRICEPRLKVFEPDISTITTHLGPMVQAELMLGRWVRELDLSHCQVLLHPSNTINPNTFYDGGLSFLRAFFSLRILKLDCLEFEEVDLHVYLLNHNSDNLLRLSIRNCSTVSCSKLSDAIAGNENGLRLLELDARDIYMDCPLSYLRRACKYTLILKNQRTEIGNGKIREHINTVRWCVGARDATAAHVGNKRSRDDELETRAANGNTETSGSKSISCDAKHNGICSLFRTGFSQKPDTEQEFFTCATCNINFGRVICSVFVKKCHDDYDTKYAGFSCGYCDCYILGECQCFELEL
jgi:hypothetical protein